MISYTGRVTVTKSKVKMEETLVARIELSGFTPDQIVRYRVVLPPDGQFTGPDASGNVAEGELPVVQVTALALPLRFDAPGPKQIAVFVEPVVSAPVAAPGPEPAGR